MKRMLGLFVLGMVAMTGLSYGEASSKSLLSSDGWTITTGAAYVYTPAFLGSKDYYSLFLPVLRFNYKDKFFASQNEGIGYNAINNDKWRLGLIAKWEGARSDKDSDGTFRVGGKKTTALNGLDKVDGTVELGGFVEYSLIDHLKAYAELRQGVNGHEGFRGDFKLTYDNNIGHVMYSFGPRFSMADNNYHDAYFTIQQDVATRTGLAAYTADSGILSYGFGGRVIVPFSKQIAAVLFGGYDHLGDEAGKSSLVTERGSRNQATGGLALVYRFNF